MTDNEIIKALECCTNYPACPTDCPLYEQPMDCLLKLSKPTLDLINRQKAEIEYLRKEYIPMLEKNCRETDKLGMEYMLENARLQAEIERLEERILEIQRCDQELIETLHKVHEQKEKTTKADAIKEFADRFENELTEIEEFYIEEEHENFISANKVIALLVNLVKEMVGEGG